MGLTDPERARAQSPKPKAQSPKPKAHRSLTMFQTLLKALALMSLFLSLGGQSAMAIEEPNYKTLMQDGNMQVRLYDARLSAVTLLKGEMDQASNQGFRRIADFIFRSNVPANPAGSGAQSGAEKIAMTAPVIVQPQSAEMSASTYQNSQNWAVEFVMPKAYTLDTLPRPINPEVQITAVPAKTYAVLTYSGFNTLKRVQQEIETLNAWIQTKGLTPLGAAQLARYDPPWTLPFWRRNEIWIEIKPLP
jgi:predicted transcriptional regulator YdeE